MESGSSAVSELPEKDARQLYLGPHKLSGLLIKPLNALPDHSNPAALTLIARITLMATVRIDSANTVSSFKFIITRLVQTLYSILLPYTVFLSPSSVITESLPRDWLAKNWRYLELGVLAESIWLTMFSRTKVLVMIIRTFWNGKSHPSSSVLCINLDIHYTPNPAKTLLLKMSSL